MEKIEKKDLFDILKIIKDLSVVKIITLGFFIYLSIVTINYKDEIVVIYRSLTSDELVVFTDMKEAQDKCYYLKNKHNAETIAFYLYQPKKQPKKYKERKVKATGSKYVLQNKNKTIDLLNRKKESLDMDMHGYALITPHSNHKMSNLLSFYGIKYLYLIPVMDENTGVRVGEVMWLFEKKRCDDKELKELKKESQIFFYYIK